MQDPHDERIDAVPRRTGDGQVSDPGFIVAATELVSMPRERLRTLFLTGVAVVVPLVVSAWVLVKIVGFVQGLLRPVGGHLRGAGVESAMTVALMQLASLLLVGVLVLLVGAVVQVRFGRQLIERVDAILSGIPGLGTVYQTARQMSDLVIDPSGEEEGSGFRDVKLVESPGQNAYTLGFLTSETPPAGVVSTARTIADDPDGEYYTLFLPMAPNPFMGGKLTHVPADRVHDVDLAIEEAVQYILTTGVVDSFEEA